MVERLSEGFIVAEDVTDNSPLLTEARMVAARSYSRLANPPLAIGEVYRELCLDGYNNNGRSRTFATADLSGTVRLVLGKNGFDEEANLEPLDIMNWMEVSRLPHREAGFLDSQAAELGRFAIAQWVATEEARNEITRALYLQAAQIAKENGIRFLYAIMPAYVIRRTRQAGIESTLVKGTSLRNTPEAEELFDMFYNYWRRHPPKLYQFSTGFEDVG